MTDIGFAIKYLESKGINAHETAGILEIPVDSPSDVLNMVSIAKHHLQDIGYDKSWQINPYYYERARSLSGEMYDTSQ